MKFLHRSRIALIALLLVLSTLFASCNFLPGFLETTPQTDNGFGTTPPATDHTTPPENNQTVPSGEPFAGPFGVEIPAYSGNLFVKVNNGTPFFENSEYTTKSYERYSNLDSLGRCGVAMACVGKDLMPTGNRGSISEVTPSGWWQATYDTVDGKYLYNRSHLIGWQLSGEDANEKNLITGTRSFNQLGMLPFENMVADYVKETNNHVLYRVTPVYVGNELVARGVLMEALSVEDDGDGICFNVFVYNNEPGIVIDYTTGRSYLEGEESQKPDGGEAVKYIANTNPSSMKFHKPDCSSVAKMSEKNKLEIVATREQMIADGYKPCGICNP
jgi:DNA-entry nuclease